MSARTWGVLVASTGVALAADLTTKAWAEAALLRHRPVPVLDEALRFTLGYNPGVAFGLFSAGGAWVLLLTGVAILALGAWIVYHLRTDGVGSWAALPVGLLFGGAVADFADRMGDGFATDFLDVGIGAARWPTFNLADAFITLGAVYLLVLSQRGTPREGSRA